ncbi:NAD(+)/NADH kinase [Algisphaera agarilytica]|uniref:NAD kinase n=1 Tax=Algisphaera agarilytica TaxID=1385975 RepID=A0A7X0H8Y5_9BACT|nr:NAD(+)/NADH kinase [Algisphaera agarilytica]MBB6431453.1 NAD+ kinase [Algisphaera agarilytica]
MPTRPRILILANMKKEPVLRAIEEFGPWLRERAEVVAVMDTWETRDGFDVEPPECDLTFVLGGDGTFLSQARVMVDRGVPLLGVNFGKVGFLADFEIEDVKAHWDAIASGTCVQTQRVMLDVDVMPMDTPKWDGKDVEPEYSYTAMNDAVITAGPPFRMIEMDLAIEPDVSQRSALTFGGDGIIVATASGSTAYNLSVGGPIVSPGVDAMVVSAIAPQSIAFRPIVFGADCDVWITMNRANEGTTLVIDGQQSTSIQEGQQVRIQRHPNRLQLFQNPNRTYWNTLSHKMHWAVRPSRT